MKVGAPTPGAADAADAADVDTVCLALGVKPAEVLRGGKRPAAVGARREVVRTLRNRLGWSWGRIARALGRSKSAIFELHGG